MTIIFKGLRKQNLDKRQLLKYLSYSVGEIIIVVIGILLAVFIDNRNQQKASSSLEIQYYRSIKDQLKEDLMIIEGEIEYNRNFYFQYSYAAKLIENKTKSEMDTLGKISFNMVRFSDFRRKSNIYQTLINSGEIVILKNKEITKGLESLEEIYLYINRLEENHSTIIFSQIIPDLKEIIRLNPVKVLRPDLLYNFRFQNDFSILTILMEEKNDVYLQGTERIQKIISLIDKELKIEQVFRPAFKLLPAEKIKFNSFVDCNMAEAWIGDTFRIFPGKYGEDPVWGQARELKYADGGNAEEVFKSTSEKFHNPEMPENAPVGKPGLHGAVWFETVYQDSKDKSGKTLYAVYHNENYPETLPYDEKTVEGYKNEKWPQGLRGPESPAAVCRIGIMKSVDGGKSWENKGIFIEDRNERMILKPHNTSNTFAGGVGDPSAVVSGKYLYLFYGEYGFPGKYDEASYNPEVEWSGQCISLARIALKDLDNPVGMAKRWDGKGFYAPHDGVGKPVLSLQIPLNEGGGPASSPTGGFHWGPSVSWNTYLNCWVMVMGKVVGKSWLGSQVFISFNKNADFSDPQKTQEWTPPQLLFEKPGYTLWYPSLQPLNEPEDVSEKYTCLRLGKRARFFVKRMKPGDDEYASEHIIEFEK